jgi:hypothetical protein
LVRNTAKISAIAVSACSPPDSSVMVCGFLPGGRARISSPASSGSSDSISCSSAVPPPNRWVNSRWKCVLTTSKAASRRSRPSRFRLWMAPAQLADRFDDVVALLDQRLQPVGKLLLLFLGAQIDGAEPLALHLQPVEFALDLAHVGHRSVGFQAGQPHHLVRGVFSVSLDARSTS